MNHCLYSIFTLLLSVFYLHSPLEHKALEYKLREGEELICLVLHCVHCAWYPAWHTVLYGEENCVHRTKNKMKQYIRKCLLPWDLRMGAEVLYLFIEELARSI